MESALIVSSSDKGNAFFSEALKKAILLRVKIVGTCGEARRYLLEHQPDLVIVNAPLPDESGEQLAQEIATQNDSMVILVTRFEIFDAVTAIVAPTGVLTVAKPIDGAVFWSALKLAESAQARIRRVLDENVKLLKRIEDIRIVDKAKYLLIANLKLSEQEAHRYIEKRAMDTRLTRREIAEEILRAYEN